MTGQCKLCLEPVTSLQNSHFLPKGIYKRLRDKNEKNPNPWEISWKTAVQTSRQKTAPLLCLDCEQRFSKYGENWALGCCLQEDGRFPLASILASRTPDMWSWKTPTTRIYYASKISEINIPALAYFAGSIFWRASVYPWSDDGTIPVLLGPFQEQFRAYLMGLKAFPKDCSLWVVVREGKIDRLTYPPVGKRMGNFHVYRFPIPGLAFTLVVSKNIPANYREMCFVHGSGNPIIVTTLIDKLLEEEAVKRLKGKPSGKKKAPPR